MKRLLIALVFLPAVCFAQGWQIGNPVGTPRALPTPGTAMNRANVDTFGNQLVTSVDSSSGARQSIVPVSNATGLNGVGAGLVGWRTVTFDVIEAGSTSTVLNLTAHAALVGDIVRFSAVSESGTTSRQWSTVCSTTANTVTLCNALSFTPTNPQDVMIMRATPAGVTANSGSGFTGLNVNVTSSLDSGATNLLKLEDAASASGDAGVMSLGVTNPQLGGGLVNSTLDYSPIATNVNGAVYTHLYSDSGAASAAKSEDSVHASGDAGIPSFSVAGTDAVVRAGSADYINPLTDLAGRTIVAPSPVDSYFNACSGTVTDTTTTDIRPAQVGLKNYISSITCSNTSAVQSRIIFRDGTTAVAVGAIPTAANGGNYSVTFPTPIRGTTNTAFRFELATTATSTQCCAQGFSVTN